MQLPFFVSCGADGKIKVFEYNTYAVKAEVEEQEVVASEGD